MSNLVGTAGFDFINGTADDDRIEGLEDNDILQGGGGSDTIVGGAGDDELRGGEGDDVFLVGLGDGSDQIYGDTGRDTILALADDISIGIGHLRDIEEISANGFSGVSLTISNGGGGVNFQNVTLTGITGIYIGAAGGEVTGTAFSDRIFGGANSDVLRGGGGVDEVHGGGGSDGLTVGPGSYFGDDGDDTFSAVSMDQDVALLSGGAGTDTYIATTGRAVPGGDFLALSGVADIVTDFQTGFGGDKIELEPMRNNGFLVGWDRVSDPFAVGYFRLQQAGSDTVFQIDRTGTGSAFVDVLRLQNVEAADLTISNFANLYSPNGKGDSYSGTDLVDRLAGSQFADTIRGLAGDDMLFDEGGDDFVYGDEGDDTFSGGLGNDTYDGGIGNDTFFDKGGNDLIAGGAGVDVIIDGLGNDTLLGEEGADTISGNAGDDVLDGGAGIDLLSYSGNDSGVLVSLARTIAQNTRGAGTDTIRNFENLEGSGFADVLVGDSGVNRLSGGAGNDRIIGGAGNDFIDGGDGIDTADYSTAQSAIKVSLARFGRQDFGLEGFDFLFSIENIVGTRFDDVITDSFAGNVINGGAGVDTLIMAGRRVSLAIAGLQDNGNGSFDKILNVENVTGDTSDNWIEGNSGNNVLNGGRGTDTIAFERATAAVTVNLAILAAQDTGGAGVDTIIGFETVIGSKFNDVLTGSSRSDVLSGELGDDILTGGLGADTLSGGKGADRFVFRSISDTPVLGRDTVYFVSADRDLIDLSRIDANTLIRGNQAFSLGGDAFTNRAGELIQVANVTSGITQGYFLQGDVDGDGVADFSIKLSVLQPLIAGDLVM